jgi:hypothetical protein
MHGFAAMPSPGIRRAATHRKRRPQRRPRHDQRHDLPTRSQAHLMRPSSLPFSRDTALAKPNYNFEKRQREIAKKKQQDEKQAKKRAARESGKPADTGHEPPTDPQ